jgi:hypothetical protein
MDNTILVQWTNGITEEKYTIGKITKCKGFYEFCYCSEVNDAIQNGFKPFECFRNIDIVYSSKFLFTVFSSRIPPENRQDIDKILLKYKLKEYDQFLLLKRSKGKLPVDTLSFS